MSGGKYTVKVTKAELDMIMRGRSRSIRKKLKIKNQKKKIYG
jgi:hypothetical protein